MAGKAGRSGRPKNEEEMVAVSTRVPRSEADAFMEYVRRKGIAATGNPDAFSVAAVLRGLMRDAVALTPEPRVTKKPRH